MGAQTARVRQNTVGPLVTSPVAVGPRYRWLRSIARSLQTWLGSSHTVRAQARVPSVPSSLRTRTHQDSAGPDEYDSLLSAASSPGELSSELLDPIATERDDEDPPEKANNEMSLRDEEWTMWVAREMAPLRTALETLEAHYDELVAIGDGKIVVIRDEDVLPEFFDTEDEALAAGRETFGSARFLIRRLRSEEGSVGIVHLDV